MNGENLRKFRFNFPPGNEGKNAYARYVARGKWRAGPVLNRRDFNKIHKGMTSGTARGSTIENLAYLTANEVRNILQGTTLNQMANKYGVNNRGLLRRYLHDRAYYFERHGGLTKHNKLQIMKRVGDIIHPNVNRYNNFQQHDLVIFIKRRSTRTGANEWRNNGKLTSAPPRYNYVSKRFVEAAPYLRNYAIPKPTNINQNTIKNAALPPGGIWLRGKENFNISQLIKNHEFMNTWRSTRKKQLFNLVEPTFKALFGRAKERQRKLTGFKEARNFAKEMISSLGGTLEERRRLAGGASGSNRVQTINSLMRGNNANNNPLKRKWVRPNSPRTIKQKVENAKVNANYYKLHRLRLEGAQLRRENNAERLRAAPPPGMTWKRNMNGTVSVVNLRNRKNKLNRYLQYYREYWKSTTPEQNGAIANLASHLVNELNLPRPVRGLTFHNGTLRTAEAELKKIQKYLENLEKNKNK
jgi:hypothetical protein